MKQIFDDDLFGAIYTGSAREALLELGCLDCISRTAVLRETILAHICASVYDCDDMQQAYSTMRELEAAAVKDVATAYYKAYQTTDDPAERERIWSHIDAMLNDYDDLLDRYELHRW